MRKTYRQLMTLFFNKKYCSYTTRHGHDLEYVSSGGKDYYRFMVFECSVCKQKFILDQAGLCEV